MENKIFNLGRKAAMALAAVAAATVMGSCTPDSYDMGGKDMTSAELAEGKAFSITHDSNNPNIVYLKSLVDSRYQVSWIEPQGRSQEQEVTLHIPFPGTYDVLFGVETRGGVVYGDTAHFTIDTFYAGFVDNELYTNLAGGVGKSETWIPDNGFQTIHRASVTIGDEYNLAGVMEGVASAQSAYNAIYPEPSASAGIAEVEAGQSQDANIYDLGGRIVGSVRDTKNILHGIYIYNNKKNVK